MTTPATLRDRITTADLDWWLALAPTLEWTFAKTYAQTAPHSYVVNGRTQGLGTADFVRAAAVIRTFGSPAKYYAMTNIYLESADGSLKWWVMDRSVSDVSLINQATTDRVYGVQDAPPTVTEFWSDYDEIATDIDRWHSPVDGDEKIGLTRILRSLSPDLGQNPAVLDVGCGTGALLDMGITTPDHYTAVDSSRAMLNELLVKHDRSRFAGVHAGQLTDVLPRLAGQTFDLVIAAFGSASYLEVDDLEAMLALGPGPTVLMAYRDGYCPAFHRSPRRTAANAHVALDRLARAHRIDLEPVGKFDVLVIDGQ